MYAVYDILATTSNNQEVARSGLSSSAGFLFNNNPSGSANTYFLVNVPGGLVNPLRNFARRTVGRHVAVGVLETGFNQAFSRVDDLDATALPLQPGSGLTDARLVVPTATADDVTLAAYLYLQNYAPETRKRVMA